ncbi:ABC transporter ATP-binding protein [Micromonospora sp. KC207]|uniref:ABC transporter ATP-binding protein n=1 Tax=Micromonospora sp. KC207 TaxID=2530377 RepID=UPI001052FBEA|nr:ABC transporter ATP-binding protein [Micromonospora sp. KC207]TDC61068.1 ABC transporter ATP-binding protein [Micromonospora sp. KC207]
MLEADALVKHYGQVTALDGFSLHVGSGQIVGLVGHNGAGKTTFANVVSGLVKPNSGSARIDGKEPKKALRQLGVAPQQIALYPTATAYETLRLFGALHGLRRRHLVDAIDEVTAALRLDNFLHRRVGILSGGQQRRAQAAVAMLHRPQVLLMDEPTAGVDPETRQALLQALRGRASAGAAIVYTTHYLPELIELGADIAVARNGQVIAQGTTQELLSDLPGNIRIDFDDETLEVSTTDAAGTLAELLRTTKKSLRRVDIRQPSLDDLYKELAHDR